MTTTQTAADTYYQALAADFNSNQWAAQYEADQIAMEFRQWEAQQAANDVPVVQLYPETAPAPAAALPVPASLPFVAELVQANDAIAKAISDLNLLILNTPDATYRGQLKAVSTSLVNGAPLMQQTKDNYLQMLEDADWSAAGYYSRPVVEAAPVAVPVTPAGGMSPYKRKYSTATEISKHLATTSSLKEIAALYYVNAELIEQTPWLKKEVLDRKARLYRPSAAAA